MEHGWIGRLTFKKVGLLLLLATLLLGILWGVMEVYARRAEAEYEAVSAAYFQGQVEFERFRETRKNYERVQYGGENTAFPGINIGWRPPSLPLASVCFSGC